MPPDPWSFRACRTTMRCGTFGKLLGADPDGVISERLARIVVLYEDLRIEVLAASAKPTQMGRLDVIGHKYRELYFLRRAIATLVEFAEAVCLLEQAAEFPPILNRLDDDQRSRWHEVSAFFRTNRAFLKRIRNDVGGHFGNDAARFAVRTIDPDFAVTVKLESDLGEKMRLSLPFAAELAAVALLRHVPGGDSEEKAKSLIAFVTKALEHAVDLVHFVLVHHWWSRLG